MLYYAPDGKEARTLVDDATLTQRFTVKGAIPLAEVVVVKDSASKKGAGLTVVTASRDYKLLASDSISAERLKSVIEPRVAAASTRRTAEFLAAYGSVRPFSGWIVRGAARESFRFTI